MTRTSLIPSRIVFIIISLSLLPGSNALSANQDVITDDGREVLLRDDGTWEFRSTDRFANTKDGRRIRLKDDGSWQYVGNAPLTSKQHIRTTDLDIKLGKVVIETHEKKVQKNTRSKSQTVFYLNLELSPLAKSDISINENDISRVKVKDSEGKEYPVLSIQAEPVILKPDSDTKVTVRVDGAPQWWKSVKSMEIIFKPGIFGLQGPFALSQSVDDIDKKKVDGFGENVHR
jgi:hypothetical protein